MKRVQGGLVMTMKPFAMGVKPVSSWQEKGILHPDIAHTRDIGNSVKLLSKKDLERWHLKVLADCDAHKARQQK